ncbi:MAG: hypothetical protein N2448_07455 [Caloramator sp.]|nr:hypothetical protein [Caloramator sp.]
MELLSVLIENLIPNNFYLNEDKIKSVRQAYENNNQKVLPPVTVAVIGEEYLLIDGHSRAFVAFENGEKDIIAEVYPIEEIPGPTKLYIYLHNKAKELNLTSIDKLKNRILNSEKHKVLWV